MDKYFSVIDSIAMEFGSLVIKTEVAGMVATSTFNITQKDAEYKLIAVGDTVCFSVTYDGLSAKDIISERHDCQRTYISDIIDAINNYK